VFLKSLTLRGFKSFADKTVLEFEPGVTVVVGPNGSGKSNLVDAVAWVLGAQGPRSLRGAKMDDVIFAGTPDRPALGRAEVSLTIDNTAHLLPIDFSEVTITRTLFRAGDSEYQLNGAPCRLLDIQELLSDSGIGRQQHVIVGQGQLDAVLNARPEDRRAIVEEAAGILKFRKRRERAERRLEATEGNLLRLNDLLREVRRQLTPLQRQADAARRHGGLVEELRAIRLHLAGHEIAGLQAKGERLRDRAEELERHQQGVQVRLRDLDLAVLDAEAALTTIGHGDVADALGRAEALRERTAGLSALLHEKRRSVDREVAAVADEGVFETLVADAAHVRAQLREVQGQDDEVRRARDEIEGAEQDLERKRALLGEAVTPDLAHDEARLVRRELETRREASARVDAELRRARSRLASARDRAALLRVEREDLERAAARAEDDAPALAAAAEAQRQALSDAEAALARAERALQTAHTDAGRWQARADALEQALDAARVAAGAAALRGVPGVVGLLGDHIRIVPGHETAVSAILGDAIHAVVVDGPTSARASVARLAAGDASALVVIADAHRVGSPPMGAPVAPPGSRFLADFVRSAVPGLEGAVQRMLGGVVLADGGWSAALDLALDHPHLTVVTEAGDRFGGSGPWRLAGGAAGATAAALDEAKQRAGAARDAIGAIERSVDAARTELATRRASATDARDAARVAAAAVDDIQRALVRVSSEFEQRVAEADAAGADESALRAQHTDDTARAAELAARLPVLEAAALEARALFETNAEERRELDATIGSTTARRRAIDLRAAQIGERRQVLERRLAEVDERLARDPERRAQAERHRAELEQRAHGYAIVGDHLAALLDRVDALLARWRVARRAEAERAADAGRQLEDLRRVRVDAERELVEIREHVQRRDVEEAETRLRLETAVERLRTEFDVEPAVALDVPAPVAPSGTTLAGRARELDRELRLMGPINPLALEEHDALLERHQFLQDQLEDVKASRRELNRVIRAVDHEIVSVFSGAFDDVSRNFTDLFATLFPGGSGRLLLTDPDDLLNTGIEMEARPSGKNVRRLSLLSGGERSLTALAFLFGVFRARPSPFYLMDEVEAALDDVNLHRFLDLVHEFRHEAQLLIVSHQKRTMEAGDCLYGVSMPPGGSSRVVSQRVNDDLPVA
jgi:chromosome segregation protein